MRRSLSFFKLAHNGKRWFATCCEYGPYTTPEHAMAAAERLNKQQAGTRKQAVEYWKTRKIQ